MTSSKTVNRSKKMQILKESLNGIVELLVMQQQERDMINMAHFKRLALIVNGMVELVKNSKLPSQNYTKDKEID